MLVHQSMTFTVWPRLSSSGTGDIVARLVTDAKLSDDQALASVCRMHAQQDVLVVIESKADQGSL